MRRYPPAHDREATLNPLADFHRRSIAMVDRISYLRDDGIAFCDKAPRPAVSGLSPSRVCVPGEAELWHRRLPGMSQIRGG